MPGFLALGAELREVREMSKKAIVFAVFVILILCFIWGQSLLPHDASDGESRGIVAWLKPLLDPNDRIDGETFHHYLRKTAHFTEFAALGFCMSGFCWNLTWKKPALRLPASFGSCVLAACVDETIQVFNPGRGPGVKDVLLDSCGAAFGILVFLLLRWILERRKKAAV